MGWFDFLRPAAAPPETHEPQHSYAGTVAALIDLKDPRLAEFMREGSYTESGASVSVKAALKNTTVIRCVSLIAFSVGMLPLHLRLKDTKEKADDHPLFRILHRKPNAWQTAFEFRSLMQQRALVEGDAYARIVRSRGNVLQLVPLQPGTVTPKQRPDWQVEYEYRRPNGGTITLAPEEVFHLRFGLSEDGITGLSLVKQAAEAIGLAIQTEKAAARLFRNGMLVGGMMSLPKGTTLSHEAYERLKAQMDEREGAAMAHKWIIGEDGLEAKPFSSTAENSQHLEQRKHQIEDIARPFGVPRPLLGVDDTSWGSGIDVLGQFFVRYGLNPWFSAWEQSIERSLLSEADADTYEAKFNAGALLRGSMKEQAEFFAAGLGSGGHQAWTDYEEVRDTLDLPKKVIAPNPLSGAAPQEPTNEPA